MDGLLPPNGDMNALDRTAVSRTLASMATLKNVPLTREERDDLAGSALSPGSIGHDPATGRTHEGYYAGEEYRHVPDGLAVVTRDREGRVLWEQFLDGHEMHLKHPEPIEAEASAHG